MKKIVAVFLSMAFFAFGNTLILTKGKYSTYIQEEEFMLAQGENIIGPIQLLPTANIDAVEIFAGNSSVTSFVVEKANQDWRKNLIGKHITIEGGGRIIRGEVISINGKYITLNSQKGFIVTTLPEFPSRISSALRWNELFSHQLTLKINSKEAVSQKIKLKYPITGINWKVIYTLNIINGIKKLNGYIVIQNNSPVDFRKIDLIILGMKERKISQISIPPFTEKRIKFVKKDIKSYSDISNLPSGKVFVYKNGVFIKSISLKAITEM